jgi:hypothetical protein
MKQAQILVRSLLALAVLALLLSALPRPAPGDEAAAGSINTLYASDPLENSLDFHTGRPGLVVQEGEVRNRDSHICLGYAPDSLAVAIQGGDKGAIVDVGTLVQCATATSTRITGNGGNAFVSIGAAWARTHEGLQQTTVNATAPARSGHVYLVRIAREGKPDMLAKLLVLEFRPGESVTFRWQLLEE